MNDETYIPDEQEPEGYDEWLRREVEIGLKEANDPNTVFVTLEESDARIDRMRVLRDNSMMEKAS